MRLFNKILNREFEIDPQQLLNDIFPMHKFEVSQSLKQQIEDYKASLTEDVGTNSRMFRSQKFALLREFANRIYEKSLQNWSLYTALLQLHKRDRSIYPIVKEAYDILTRNYNWIKSLNLTPPPGLYVQTLHENVRPQFVPSPCDGVEFLEPD